MSERKAFLDEAIAYAQRRWCWDDPAHLDELFDRDSPLGELVEDWVDYYAAQFELQDPNDVLITSNGKELVAQSCRVEDDEIRTFGKVEKVG